MDPKDQSPLGPRQKAEVGTGVAREEWDPGVWDAPLTSCVTLESLHSLSEPQFPCL